MNSQLALFAPEAPPASAAPLRVGGGPASVQRRFALAFSESVKLELLAVAAARPGEWLQWSAFSGPREKHQIGFCMGHVLHALVGEGRLQERAIHFGSGIGTEQPGAPGYQGSMCEWRSV